MKLSMDRSEFLQGAHTSEAVHGALAFGNEGENSRIDYSCASPFHGGVAGLLLQVKESGNCSWCYRYTFDNKRHELGLGSYPALSLLKARVITQKHQLNVANGINPMAEKKARKENSISSQNEITFKAAFYEYFKSKKSPELSNKKHIQQWENTVKTYVFPFIGENSMRSITTQDVKEVLDRIWNTKNETADRVRGRIERVFDWAKTMKYYEGENPAAWRGNLDNLLAAPGKIQNVVHQPAIQMNDAGRFFALLKQNPAMSAKPLMFLMLTATRSGEVRGASWSEIDLEKNTWTIPASRMKARKEHVVPLSLVAVSLLMSLPRFVGNDLIFPSSKAGSGNTISDMTLSKLMKSIHAQDIKNGGKGFLDKISQRIAVPHGLRSTFRDWAADCTEASHEAVELSLAHTVGNKVTQAYMRTDLLDKRRTLMEK